MGTLPTGTTSERLTLRLLRSGDAEGLQAAVAASIEHLRPWMPWATTVPTIEEEREIIAGAEARWRSGGDAMYGVFAGDTIVGGTGLHHRAGPDTLEIGYWIHVDHIGQGYATELAGALTDLAFTIDGIEHVEIHHDAANVRSAAVPRKLGFDHVATAPREPLAPAHSGVDWSWRVSRDAWRRHIWFAGRRWWVKHSTTPVGPGCNRFDGSPAGVSVVDGQLVLRILRDAEGWTCAEVVGVDETGYGVYEWTVASDLHGLDAQAVVGMFTWSDDPEHANRELDIEIGAQFGGPIFVAPPDEHSFALPAAVPWRCSIDWRPDAVTFRAAGGAPWTRPSPPPQGGGVSPRINLWLSCGLPPAGTDPIELRIDDFRFTPHA